jgi:hypothetical protein
MSSRPRFSAIALAFSMDDIYGGGKLSVGRL